LGSSAISVSRPAFDGILGKTLVAIAQIVFDRVSIGEASRAAINAAFQGIEDFAFDKREEIDSDDTPYQLRRLGRDADGVAGAQGMSDDEGGSFAEMANDADNVIRVVRGLVAGGRIAAAMSTLINGDDPEMVGQPGLDGSPNVAIRRDAVQQDERHAFARFRREYRSTRQIVACADLCG